MEKDGRSMLGYLGMLFSPIYIWKYPPWLDPTYYHRIYHLFTTIELDLHSEERLFLT